MNNNNQVIKNIHRKKFELVEYKFLMQGTIRNQVMLHLKDKFNVDDEGEGRKYIVIEEKGWEEEEREKILTRDEKAIKEEQGKGKVDNIECDKCERSIRKEDEDEAYIGKGFYVCDQCRSDNNKEER